MLASSSSNVQASRRLLVWVALVPLVPLASASCATEVQTAREQSAGAPSSSGAAATAGKPAVSGYSGGGVGSGGTHSAAGAGFTGGDGASSGASSGAGAGGSSPSGAAGASGAGSAAGSSSVGGAAGGAGGGNTTCSWLFAYADTTASEVTSVHVTGSFNGWSEPGSALLYDEDEQRWEVTLELEPATYQYKFVVNGSSWVTDPDNPETVDDGDGNVNSVVTVSCP